jgi:hypothetical protein
MVIEYGLIFLASLDKKGVTIHAANPQTATGKKPLSISGPSQP